MYQNVFIDRRNEKIYLWDDVLSLIELPMSSVRYAYRRCIGGKYKSLYGDELEKVTSFSEDDPTLFESDVYPEVKVLIDAYEESDEPSKGNKIVIIDIEVDISTGFCNVEEGDKPITAIALYDQLSAEYFCFVLDPEKKITPGKRNDETIWSFRDEEQLLEAFLTKWEEIRPTIVSGWNSTWFDMPYLFNRIRGVLGKAAGYRLSPIHIAYQNKFNKRMTIAGVSCMDYMDLYKKFIGTEKPSYSLSNVAKDEELKIQKLTYKGNLSELYKNDLSRYIEYNITDVRVVVELDKKYDFIYLARSVCHKGHVPYEWFQMSSRFIDGAILMYLRRNGNLIAPNKPVGGKEEYEKMERQGEEGFTGAYVKEPTPGLYDWICSADITSLYPSVIMSLNISPETKIGKIENWNYRSFLANEMTSAKVNDISYTIDDFKKMISNYTFSIGSNGTVYRQDKMGVIPTILDLWFNERIEYRTLAAKYGKEGDKEKEAFYDRRQKRQKIFLNSVYGTLGLPIFRFYDRDNAEAVTLSGQEIIHGAEKVVNDYFNARLPVIKDRIVYVDTDSNYFSIKELADSMNIPPSQMVQFSIDTLSSICNKINDFYNFMVPKAFNVEPAKNRIKIVGDVIATKALWIAKKRYAMLKVWDMEKMKAVKDKTGEEGKLEVKGIDTVRSSFPAAFRKFAGKILNNILRGIPHEIIDEDIMKFEEAIDTYSIYDLAKTTSVNFISKNGEHNYNPSIRRPFEVVPGTPVGVKSALAYNDLLKAWKLDKKVEKIITGQKVKYVYVLPNEFCLECLAMKADDTDPDEILEFISNHINRKKMYDRELKSKLEEIYHCIGWKFPNRGSQIAEKVFDFDEAW